MSSTNWRTIKVFISSTFNDMHSERDVIRKRVIPRLNEALSQYKISVITTDLRWGVDTDGLDEATREAKVLRVCMDAITSSKPYFVALIGHRYGWVPPKGRIDRFIDSIPDSDSDVLPSGQSPRSVTEMEILLGALGSSERLDHSFFCFRDPESYEQMDRNIIKAYVDDLSDNPEIRENAVKLESLKSRIKEACSGEPQRLISYSGKWDNETKCFTELDKFADELYKRLLKDILEEYHNIVATEIRETEEESLDSFIAGNVANFCGRTELLDYLTDFVINHRTAQSVLDNKLGLVLEGESGSGKSYIFSALCTRLKAISKENHLVVLPHAIGITPSSVSVEYIARHWHAQLANALGIDANEEKVDRELLTTLAMRLQVRGQYPVMIIDSIDSLANPDTLFDIIPFNVPLICTSTPRCVSNRILEGRFTVMNISGFNQEEAIGLIETVFRKNDKELPADLTDTIMAVGEGKPAYQSPLWLKLAVTILTEIGGDDFQEINKFSAGSYGVKITDYLMQVTRDFPGNPDDMFRYFIDFSAKFFNRDLTIDTLCFMAISQYGIEERYLVKLIGDEWNQLEFESLRIWLRDFMTRSIDGQSWKLSHNVLRRVLMQDSRKDYRNIFLNMLGAEVTHDRKLVDELIYQIICLDAVDCLAGYVENGSLDSYSIAKAVLRATDILGIDSILHFLKLYIERFYLLDSEWIETFTYLVEDSNHDYLTKNFLDVYSQLISCFDREEFRKGNLDLLGMVFERYSLYIDHVIKLDKDTNGTETNLKLECLRADVIELYLELKQILGIELVSDIFSTYASVFHIWNNYLHTLDKYCKDIEILEVEETRFLDVLEWTIKNVKYPSDLPFWYRIQCRHFFYFDSMRDNSRYHKFKPRIYRFFKSLYPGDNAPDYQRESYYNELDELNKDLVDSGESIDALVSESREYKPTPIVQEDNRKIYRISEADLLSPARKDFSPRKNADQRGKDKLTQEIEGYLNLFPDMAIKACDKAKFSPMLDKLLCYLFVSSRTYLGNVLNKDKFLNLSVSEILPHVMQRRYWNGEIDDYIESYIRFASRFVGINAIEALDGLLNSLWHQFFISPGNDDYIFIMLRLQEEYQAKGRVEDVAAMYEKAFDLAAASYLAEPFDIYFMRFKSACDILPYYSRLIEAYSAVGEISGAVKCITQWLDICDMAYTGQRDVNPCAKHYDMAYGDLARLYDGTGALAEAVCRYGQRFMRDGILPICHKELWGYMDLSSRIVIPCQFRWASRAGGKYLSVSNGKKMAYIDYDGNPVTKFIFDEVLTMSGDLGWVEKRGKYSIFDSGEFIPITKRFGFAGGFHNGNLKVELHGEYTNLIRPDGKSFLLEEPSNGLFTSDDDKLIVTRRFDATRGVEEGRYQAFLWGADGNLIMREENICPFGNADITPVYNHNLGLGGYINRKGELITEMKYCRVRPVSESKAAVAAEHPQYLGREIWGFINSDGQEIITPQYDFVGDFNCGLAWVCKVATYNEGYTCKEPESKFGFIDEGGQLVIPMIYDDVSSFRDGVATVWLNEEMLQISLPSTEIADNQLEDK